MLRSIQHTGAVAMALLVAACAHNEAGMGTGSAGSGPAAQPVEFSWKSSDAGQTGTMSAVVGLRTFSGPFLQIRQNVHSEGLAPMWTGWAPGWHDWGFWGPVPVDQFTTRYSGKVVANLSSPDARMRCLFHLADPRAGMGGGGQGECQDGSETISAVFDRS
jgi:hypothetical protein